MRETAIAGDARLQTIKAWQRAHALSIAVQKRTNDTEPLTAELSSHLSPLALIAEVVL
jgi:hypothetical protein